MDWGVVLGIKSRISASLLTILAGGLMLVNCDTVILKRELSKSNIK